MVTTTPTSAPYRSASNPRLRRRDTENGSNGGMEESTGTHPTPNRRGPQHATTTKTSGLFGASSNLVNSIVGAGIIGIPYALNQAGLLVGVGLLVAVAYSTDKSLRMLIELASFHPQLRHCNIRTYEDLARIPFGPIGSNCVLAAMFIMAYGAMVAYLLIIKDTIPVVLGFDDTILGREVVMAVSSAVFILPLALLRDMSALACTSLLSVTGDAVLVGLIIFFAPFASTVEENGGIGSVMLNYWFDKRLFIGLGVLSTAMACQHSAFLISGSLERPTPQRWAIVTGRSLTVAALMSVLLGVFGYLGYLDATEGNVLNNFPRGSVTVNGGRALLGLTMYLTFPMESFVARHVVVQLFFGGNMDNTTVGPDGEQIPEAKYLGVLGRREIVTLCLFLLALLPALLVDDLGPVLSITGSMGASCIAYIAPGLVYLGVHGADFLDWASGSIRGSASRKREAGGEVELPVVGNASASMNAIPQDRTVLVSEGGKPWWWSLAGMPIWISIASVGERGTREFLNELGVDPNSTGYDDDEGADEGVEHIVGPKHRDFYISIVFVVFGVIAAVCGVVSNVYVQIHDIFFSPH